MALDRRSVIKTAAALPTLAAAAPFRAARAQANTVKIGVLNDGSGMYRDISGQSSAVCARQAVQDFGPRGFNVEILFADHQNKPDVGSNIARQWIDRDGVDVILDVTTSSVALAVNDVCREKNKVHINSTAATSDLTGPRCTPNTVHWTYDTWMLARSTGGAMVKAGGDTWFFITADYAFGHALERDTSNFVRPRAGGCWGRCARPSPAPPTSPPSWCRRRPRAPKVIGLANAGSDTINCIKQAAEFGLTRRGIKLASLLMFINDVHALGLQTAQGLVCTETFYWDLNDRTRAFTGRVRPNLAGNMPAMTHAGCYAGVLHYLKAVQDMGVAQAKASGADAVARMKAMPTDDDCFGAGTHPPGRAQGPPGLPVRGEEALPRARALGTTTSFCSTTPAEEAFRPIAEGGCPLVRS